MADGQERSDIPEPFRRGNPEVGDHENIATLLYRFTGERIRFTDGLWHRSDARGGAVAVPAQDENNLRAAEQDDERLHGAIIRRFGRRAHERHFAAFGTRAESDDLKRAAV